MSDGPPRSEDGPAHDLTRTTVISEAGTAPVPSASTSSLRLDAGKLAGRYELLGLIGVGGMGSVYRARDTELDELVAVKVLRRDLGTDEAMLGRFRQEVKLARKVTHTAVARTFDLGEHEGERFITMELIPGESLATTIAKEGAMPFARFAEIASQICSGLTAAHAAGVIHRDLKPDNVILTPQGRAVITDFGIARAAASNAAQRTLGGPVGTPAYMAPEQVEARPDIDARADLYALGAMMFELLTGQQPWRGDSIFAIAAARLLSPPPDPRTLRASLPDAIATLVMKCMARKPEDRPASAEDVAMRLASVTLPAAQSTPSLVPVRLNEPVAHHKTVAVLPFQSGGADAYLVDGLTDDLIDTLSMTTGLRVRPRSAVAHLRDSSRDARDLGRELGVQVVVEGSVRMKGEDELRVTARLLSVADGFQLWAQRWDGKRSDVLKIGDDAARAIAKALTVAEQPARRAISDAEAIDLYLRARHEFLKFGPAAIGRSVELFGKAHQRAPEDATILSGYALAIARLLSMPVAGPARLEDARRIAEEALRVAPHSGEGLVALSAVELHAGNFELSARLLGEADARAPLLPDVAERVAMLLTETGPAASALLRVERAMALEPRFQHLRYLMARTFALDGDWDSCLEWTEDSGRRLADENIHWIGRLRLAAWKNDRGFARKLLAETEDRDFILKPIIVILCHTVIDGAITPEGRMMFNHVMTAIPTTGRGRSTFNQVAAEISAFVGDDELALTAVEQSVNEGLFDLEWFDKCPVFLRLREDPRYGAMRPRVLARANAIRAALGAPLSV